MGRTDDSGPTPKRPSDPAAERESRDEERTRDALVGFATVSVSFFAGVLFGTYLAFSDPRVADWLLSGWYVYLIAAVSTILGTTIVFGYQYWKDRRE